MYFVKIILNVNTFIKIGKFIKKTECNEIAGKNYDK